MKWLSVLASLGLACAGARPAPRPSCPDCSNVTCPTCPDATCPTCRECDECPACPACLSPYRDTEGWYCIDDPAPNAGQKAYSYCYAKKAYCDYAYSKYAKDRPTIKPCRAQMSVYCFELHSPQFQILRYDCSKTIEHCEAHQKNVLAKLEPHGDYRWTQCTEQP